MADTKGFQPGRKIVIDEGTALEETNYVAGGSNSTATPLPGARVLSMGVLNLLHALLYAHPASALIAEPKLTAGGSVVSTASKTASDSTTVPPGGCTWIAPNSCQMPFHTQGVVYHECTTDKNPKGGMLQFLKQQDYWCMDAHGTRIKCHKQCSGMSKLTKGIIGGTVASAAAAGVGLVAFEMNKNHKHKPSPAPAPLPAKVIMSFPGGQGFQGAWKKCGTSEDYSIHGHTVTWNSGKTTTLTAVGSSQVRTTAPAGGASFTGRLQNGDLYWDNGSIWNRDGGSCPEAAVKTTLSESVQPGEVKLPVASMAGFTIGRKVIIEGGSANEEVGTISAFGSLILAQPLQKSHPKGATIVEQIEQEASATTKAPDTTGTLTEQQKRHLVVSGISVIVLCLCCCVFGLAFCSVLGKKKRRTGQFDKAQGDDRMYANLEEPPGPTDSLMMASPYKDYQGVPTTSEYLSPTESFPMSQINTQNVSQLPPIPPLVPTMPASTLTTPMPTTLTPSYRTRAPVPTTMTPSTRLVGGVVRR